MARTGLMASTANSFSFAHLLGLSGATAGKPKAEDDPNKKSPEKEDDSVKGKGNAKADKPDDQGEDESDEDYKDRKKREEDDAKAEEDDDEEMDKDEKSKASRRRERARCAAIFSSPAAGLRPDLAAHFAFSTNMSRRDAVAALEVAAQGAAPAVRRGTLSERMAQQPNPNIRPDSEPQAAKPGERLMAAHALATGKKA